MRSDEALFEALTGGDERAFDALYERHSRPLFGFIRKHLGDKAEAEDVLNETFLAVLRDRAGAKAALSFRAWLFTVARNLCLNRQRSAQRTQRALEKEARVEPAAPALPEAALEQHQDLEALRHAVAALPFDLAELFALRSKGLSYEEMAGVLAVPLGTVKSRMHQMVSLLREELQR